jgi:hypothetical protein
MADQREEFQKMCDQWDAALKKGIFTTKPAKSAPERQPAPAGDQYGMSPQMASLAANSENINDVDYWNAVFRLSRGEQVDIRSVDDAGEPTVLRESDGAWPAKSPNPVPLWTRGKDQKNVPSHWFDRSDFDKLARMREELHDLGDKLAGHDGRGERGKAEAALKKIRSLQRELDEFSNTFGTPREEKRS